MEPEYKRAGIEPPLEDLLNDRIAHLIMRRDGITLADVWRLVGRCARVSWRARSTVQNPRHLRPSSPVPTARPAPTPDLLPAEATRFLSDNALPTVSPTDIASVAGASADIAPNPVDPSRNRLY